jgi:hypothetical protein
MSTPPAPGYPDPKDRSVPDVEGSRPSSLASAAVILALLGVVMSIPFSVSYDGLPSTDARSVPGFGLWLSALVVMVVSLILAVVSRREEQARRSRLGKIMATVGFWLALIGLCVWLLAGCSIVGAGL